MATAKTLSLKEIKDITDTLPKAYRLEAYRTLKNAKFSPDAKAEDLKNLKVQLKDYFKQDNLPRLLSEKEITDILSVLKPIPATIKTISEDNLRQVKEKLRRQFASLKFSVKEGTIDEIKKEIKRQYITSICPAGESVGVNSAVSIGQPLTQANLNTFHKSGSKNANKGTIGYLLKLFNVSKAKEDVIVTHFKDKNLTREEISIISRNLKGITVDKLLVDNYEIMSEIPEEDKDWYENYLTVMGSKFIYKGHKFLRVRLNLTKCYHYDIFIQDIVKAIEKNNRSSEIRQAVKCIASSTYKGIIDIHVEPEFIKLYINRINQTVKQNKIPGDKLEELIEIFLTKLQPDSFKEMLVKGIKNIEHITISEGIDMNITYNERPVIDESDLSKFSAKPYNLKMEDISRLWCIRVQKKFLLFEGINTDKYVKFFEAAGLKIIENKLDEADHELYLLMPKKLDSMYYDEKDKKNKPLYSLNKNGTLYNNKDNSIVTNMSPKSYIQQKLSYIESQLFMEIDKNIKSLEKIYSSDLPIIPPLYRYGYYYYTAIEGKGIIKDLINNPLVDYRFTHPDNVYSVYELLGIEATRFYFVSKYMDIPDKTDKINPVNLEMLIDFQTALGIPLPVSYTGISKITSGLLSSVSFEKSMDTFQEGSAFGTVDEIKGISGCIMTGNYCRNGSGFAEVEFDNDYIKDKNNQNENFKSTKNIPLEADFLVGPCYSTIPKDLQNDYNIANSEDNIALNIEEQGKPSELTLKEDIPEPPRMEAPDFLISQLDETPINLEEYQEPENLKLDEILDIDDIPEDPGILEEDYF